MPLGSEILSPPTAGPGSSSPSFVLVLILIGDPNRSASEYKQLGLALQETLKSSAQAWVAILGTPCLDALHSETDLQDSVDQLSKDLDQVVAKLVESGAIVKPQFSPRIRNGVFLAHGAGSVVAQELAFGRGVGFISISSPLRMPFPTQWFWPVMLLSGELDEAIPLSQLAPPMLDVVQNFKEHGKAKTVKQKPIVVLPDTNLAEVLENEEVMEQVCHVIGDFLKLNSIPGCGGDRQLFEGLERAMGFSISLVAPYVKVLGRGDLLMELAKQDAIPGSCSADASSIDYAKGVEIFSQVTRPESKFALEERAALATPGELAALRDFSKAVQTKALEGFLGADVVSRVKVNVQQATVFKLFVWGQPTVEMLDSEETAGEFDAALTVRALLHHPHLDGCQTHNSTAPSYWIKCKKPSAVSILLHPTDIEAVRKLDSNFDSQFSAQKVMEEALENVLTLVSPRVKERYEKSGVKVKFADKNIEFGTKWALESDWEVKFNAGENVWEVICAIHKGGSLSQDGKPAPMLFGSALYMKVPSPAWLLEFISSRYAHKAKSDDSS
ncbi:hypothetical protein BSKO_06464 [Bryopsis sp. KO-2023]|nr:hypothetical protein BSKO_06464 [Bryopsis sp. KO-2023]